MTSLNFSQSSHDLLELLRAQGPFVGQVENLEGLHQNFLCRGWTVLLLEELDEAVEVQAALGKLTQELVQLLIRWILTESTEEDPNLREAKEPVAVTVQEPEIFAEVFELLLGEVAFLRILKVHLHDDDLRRLRLLLLICLLLL